MLRVVGHDFTLDDTRARHGLGDRPVVIWTEGIATMMQASVEKQAACLR